MKESSQAQGLRPELSALTAAVGADPGARGFPALAEAHRRAGRPDEAERVAREGLSRRPERVEARVVLSLALIDQGRPEEARAALERVADELLRTQAPPGDPRQATEGEIERAFQDAETDPRQVFDADRVAREAMEGSDLAVPEVFDPSAGRTFATETMAGLLARQGDVEGASRIRAALRQPERPEASPGFEWLAGPEPGAGEIDPDDPGEGLFPLDAPLRRRGVIQTLERWLENLQRR